MSRQTCLPHCLTCLQIDLVPHKDEQQVATRATLQKGVNQRPLSGRQFRASYPSSRAKSTQPRMLSKDSSTTAPL